MIVKVCLIIILQKKNMNSIQKISRGLHVHKNERNYQERSHRSEKRTERKERVLKNIGMEGGNRNRTERILS